MRCSIPTTPRQGTASRPAVTRRPSAARTRRRDRLRGEPEALPHGRPGGPAHRTSAMPMIVPRSPTPALPAHGPRGLFDRHPRVHLRRQTRSRTSFCSLFGEQRPRRQAHHPAPRCRPASNSSCARSASATSLPLAMMMASSGPAGLRRNITPAPYSACRCAYLSVKDFHFLFGKTTALDAPSRASTTCQASRTSFRRRSADPPQAGVAPDASHCSTGRWVGPSSPIRSSRACTRARPAGPSAPTTSAVRAGNRRRSRSQPELAEARTAPARSLPAAAGRFPGTEVQVLPAVVVRLEVTSAVERQPGPRRRGEVGGAGQQPGHSGAMTFSTCGLAVRPATSPSSGGTPEPASQPPAGPRW